MCQTACKPSFHKTAKSLGLLALRIALAIIFIYMGYNKLGPSHLMASSMMGKVIGPESAGSLWAYLVGGLEVVGGIMVLLGVYASVAAVWLAVIMVVAMFTAHAPHSPLPTYFLEVMVLGGALALAGTGAGKWRVLKTECCCKECRTKGAGCAGGCCSDKKNGAEEKGGCCGGACGGNCGEKACGCGKSDCAECGKKGEHSEETKA